MATQVVDSLRMNEQKILDLQLLDPRFMAAPFSFNELRSSHLAVREMRCRSVGA
jgi:hypothetical protein